MGQHQCQGRKAAAPDHRVARMDQPARARENREYVRALLRQRQPEFAAALELAYQELSGTCGR